MATTLLLSPAAVRAQKLPAPIFDGLGSHHHPVSTASTKAQRYFDQGLILCYAFNHREAIRSFQAATQLDPNLAMAYWGIAYASGPHVNRSMDQEDNQRAWAALVRIAPLKSKVTAKERAYLEAIEARYSAELPTDRAALDKAYANAMREVVRQFQDDLDAQVLLAEAIMDTMPWDYWTRDRSPKPETEEALAALRFVMARDPNHPGANHLYIHAVEAGPNPEWGLPAADRLGPYAPHAGHLVHMPAHIYMRVGLYNEAILANERATKADQSYIRHCRAQGFYPGVYYPHNIHFLWWAQLYDGRAKEALRTAHKAAQYALDNYCGPKKAAEAPRLRHLPWLTQARLGRWNDVLIVPQPAATNDFLVDRAMWHFTRGLAYAALNNPDAAGQELTALRATIHTPEAMKLNAPTFPATNILGIAEHWLASKVSIARGDVAAGLERLRETVALEDAMPYMEPAYWPFPVRPTLGAAELIAGRAADAEVTFREDLRRWPRNAWGLLGLEQSLRRQNKIESADLVRSEFKKAWKDADVVLDLAWY